MDEPSFAYIPHDALLEIFKHTKKSALKSVALTSKR